MKPTHLLIAVSIITAFAFIAYRGGEAPVQASIDSTPEAPVVAQQKPQTE